MEPRLRRKPGVNGTISESIEGIPDASILLQKAKNRILLAYHELPEWEQDNDHILSGWRAETGSYLECMKSMLYIHNETGNIYSHLFASLWMIALGIWWSNYASNRYPEYSSDDAAVFFLFFTGGALCFFLSVCYHLFRNHSHTTSLFCLKLDFLGILTVTAGCFPPGLWYTFPCASRQLKFTLITVNLVAQFCAALLALFSTTFQARSMRPLRGFVFSVMASSAFYPIIAKIFQVGWTRANEEYGASLYGLTIVVYLVSTLTYALRVTEAWKPGAFDIWGHSHQLFHIGMAVGLTIHFTAFIRAVDQFYIVKQGQCPDP